MEIRSIAPSRELFQNIAEKPPVGKEEKPSQNETKPLNLDNSAKTVPPNKKDGVVMGQLSTVSKEAEAGTNMVMNFLENALVVNEKQKKNINELIAKEENELSIKDFKNFVKNSNDSILLIDDLIFNAMDAFQFQDINRQKLDKVMHTLAKLNEYLNELLGMNEKKGQTFGHSIEKTNLQRDSNKDDVDNIIETFKKEK